MPDLAALAERFRLLHHGPGILRLPNAWDAGSARIFEQAGFAALATTSAGIAAAVGYPDGQTTTRDEMLEAIGRIARAVAIPVTADMEQGYGPTVADAEATARGVIQEGAIGLNFEDRHAGVLLDPALQSDRIRAIRAVATKAGVPLVINARTDVYLLQQGAPEAWLDEAVRRANLYRDAGADCLFVPGARDPQTIAALVRAIHGPINILAMPGVPSAPELERLGVARVSIGSGPMRATQRLTRRAAEELFREGTYAAFLQP